MELKDIRAEYSKICEGVVPPEELLQWHADFIAALEDAVKNRKPLYYLSEIGLALPADYDTGSIDDLFETLHRYLKGQRHASYLTKSGPNALFRFGDEFRALKSAVVDLENHLYEWNEGALLKAWEALVLDTAQAQRAACNGLRADFIQLQAKMRPSEDARNHNAFLHPWIDDASHDMNILGLPSPLELARIVGELALFTLDAGILSLTDEQPAGIEIPAFIESIIGGLLNGFEYAQAFTQTSLDQARKRLDAAESLIVDLIHGEKATLPRWDAGPFEGILELFTGNSRQALPARVNRDDPPLPTVFSPDALAGVGPLLALAAQKIQAAPDFDEPQWHAGREALPPFLRSVLEVLLEMANDDRKDSYGMDTIGRIRWLFSLCKDEVAVVAGILQQWFLLNNEPMNRYSPLFSRPDILARFRNVALEACAYTAPDTALREFVRLIDAEAVLPYQTMIKLIAVVSHALGAALRQVPLPQDEESAAAFRLLQSALTQPGRLLANSRITSEAERRLQDRNREALTSFTAAEDEAFRRLEAQYQEARAGLIAGSRHAADNV